MLKDNILQDSLLGLRLPIHIKVPQTAEYCHPIFNAGTAKPNEPLNPSKILFGISPFHW